MRDNRQTINRNVLLLNLLLAKPLKLVLMVAKSFLVLPILTLLMAVSVINTSYADIEKARTLMKQSDFVTARQLLLPAAQAGNADAEELIGVMYAMGLGVERDDKRAFEWYLRASMKGHPGAQSGIGWYYEVGRGMPAPDLVRGYMWYVLSAIGGDIDAAISQQEIVKKMTKAQIAEAKILIQDYRAYLYPFKE